MQTFVNISFGVYILMKRGGWRYRPFPLNKEVKEAKKWNIQFPPEFLVQVKSLKVKTGKSTIKYGTKLSNAIIRCVKSEA